MYKLKIFISNLNWHVNSNNKIKYLMNNSKKKCRRTRNETDSERNF